MKVFGVSDRYKNTTIWIKRCLANPKSIWYFIPNHIFDKIGSLSFILKCNYLPSKPVVLKLFQDEAHLCKVNYFVAPQKKTHDENILLQ